MSPLGDARAGGGEAQRKSDVLPLLGIERAGAEPAAHAVLAQALASQLYAQALSLAARLGIADLLAGGPRGVDDLARATGTHEPTLYRVLRALASMGVFVEGKGRRFGLAPPSELLRRDAPGAARAVAVLLGDAWRAAAYHLPEAVRTGRPAFEHAFGTTLYEYLTRHPDAHEAFDGAMAGFWDEARAAVLDAYDFSPFRRIVDVGGGTGALLAAVLARCPAATGVLLEAPPVAERAARVLASSPCRARLEIVAGDFFRGVPAAGDAYVLSFVLHNWDDDHAAAILRCCRRAMSGAARLVIVESVVPPGAGPSYAKVLDFEMLVFTPGGRERAEPEFRALLQSSGFEHRRTVPTASSASVIEATPAG